ncbi:MAG: hypothetical protein GEU78_17770, partial [Actinobacteria bacterium]|nr:hypothetical protein [Actinomycetota bacterium]
MGFVYHQSWYYRLKSAPRLLRAARAVESETPEPGLEDAEGARSPERLTRQVHAQAEAVGLSRIGVAAWDPKYTFEPYHDEIIGDRIIVCVLEQDWEATQQIPSEAGAMAQLTTYAVLMERALKLAAWIREMGFRAKVHPPEGRSLVLHYAVDAGMGQLGLNGQVLTLTAGSRCRGLSQFCRSARCSDRVTR